MDSVKTIQHKGHNIVHRARADASYGRGYYIDVEGRTLRFSTLVAAQLAISTGHVFDSASSNIPGLARFKWSLRLSFLGGPSFRNKPADRPRSLYAALRINGVGTTSEYCTHIRVRPDSWDQKNQRVLGTDAEARRLNADIANVLEQHRVIIEEYQKRYGITPDPTTVMLAWTRPTPLPPGILEAYDQYVAFIKATPDEFEQKKPGTLLKWERGRKYLAEFIAAKFRRNDLPLVRIDIPFVKEFHRFLMQDKPENAVRMSRNTAIKFTAYLRPILSYQVERKNLDTNPLLSLTLKRSPEAEIVYMTQAHLEALAGLTLEGTLAKVRDLALLMSYTALDLADLRKVIADPDLYRLRSQTGFDRLEIRRGKTKGRCVIPMLPGVPNLINRLRAGNYMPVEQVCNRGLKTLAVMIGFSGKLTCKTCRKTGATLFLNQGFSIEAVAKILGNTIRICQQHYAMLLDRRVEKEVAQIGLFDVPLPLSSPDAPQA
jgi:hypothetical protein